MTVAGLGFLIFAVMLLFVAIIEIKNESINYRYSLIYAVMALTAGVYLIGTAPVIF